VASFSAEGPSAAPGTQRSQQLMDATLAYLPVAGFAAVSGLVLMTLRLDRGQIQLKAEQALLKAELRADQAQLKAELKADLAELRFSVMNKLDNLERSLQDGQAKRGRLSR
jgi:hypothetical protein